MRRSKHSLSHYKLLSCNLGKLVPIGMVEVLPGDTFQHSTGALIRVSPLNTPVMHPVHAKIHHFFVPHRLVWNEWEDFITGGPTGSSAPTFPQITIPGGGFAVGSLAQYLGVPASVGAGQTVSALPFRAVGLVFNEYYRDQDLVTERVVNLASGVDATTDLTLPDAAWEKDYFTSARPWEQKGPTISIPLTGNAAVKGKAGVTPKFHRSGTDFTDGDLKYTSGGAGTFGPNTPGGASSGLVTWDTTQTGLETDLSSVAAADMNDLRLAMALQRYEEARARYGSRYTEYLRYLGVKSSDARLQRPEYLGGGRQTIQFSEVVQSSVNFDANTGVGNLRGHGIGAMRSNRYRRFFEEHGYIISFLIVRPRTMYVQGLPRTWNRRTKEDFWQQELEHVGQQAILNKEVYLAHTTPAGTFGYQDRYDEYRRMESSIAGEFASTLDTWHYGRIFAGDPTLNSSFVQSNPTTRVYQSTATNQLQVMAQHSIQARRLVAKTGSSFIF